MTRPPFATSLLKRRQLIGMIHLQALPGAPAHHLPVDDIAEHACREAQLYRECGIDTVMVENMHDVPYVKQVGPEITAAMTRVTREVRNLGLTVGIQILAGANREAVAVALATGASFVRVEGFVYAHVADEGLIEACAGDLMRYRKAIGAEHIAILADIKKKHASHAITADVDLAETARTAAMFGADGIIVTGPSTGSPADLADVRTVRTAVDCPVLVGSGVTTGNLPELLAHADGLIVGSSVKHKDHWAQDVDPQRAARLRQVFDNAVANLKRSPVETSSTNQQGTP